jgi:thiamine biosynthesis lipoprotein
VSLLDCYRADAAELESHGARTANPRSIPPAWSRAGPVEQAFTELTARLAALGPHDALPSAGGDVIVACTRTDTRDWSIAVEDPCDRSRVLLTIPLRSGAVATSGTAARGKHIVDPATGAPPRGLPSTTIIGPSLTWADVDATAAFVRGRNAAHWIATRPEHAAVLVGTDGSIEKLPADPDGRAARRTAKG